MAGAIDEGDCHAPDVTASASAAARRAVARDAVTAVPSGNHVDV